MNIKKRLHFLIDIKMQELRLLKKELKASQNDALKADLQKRINFLDGFIMGLEEAYGMTLEKPLEEEF